MPTHQRCDGKPRASTTVLMSPVPEFVRNGFAGAASGAVSRVLTAPFDVAKIRFQLDHGAAPRYKTSLWAAMRSIYAEEGLVSLWRGNMAAMLLWTTFAGVQFGTYEKLRSTDVLRSKGASRGSLANTQRGTAGRGETAGLDRRVDGPPLPRGEWGAWRGGVHPSVANFVYGAIAGGLATVVSYPFDIARTALAFQGVPKRYGSIGAFVIHIIRETGPRGLFRGLSAALAMVAPQMGVAFAVYERVKNSPPALLTGTASGEATGGGERTQVTPGKTHMVREQIGRRRDTGGGEEVGAGRRDVHSCGEDGDKEKAASGGGRGAGDRAGSRERHHRGKTRERWVKTAWPLAAGAAAGMTSKLAVFPLDTVKKRVQTEVMFERDIAYGILPKYSGPINAFRTILREEGTLALFRGSVPAMWKSGVSTAITFAVYEWVKAGMALTD